MDAASSAGGAIAASSPPIVTCERSARLFVRGLWGTDRPTPDCLDVEHVQGVYVQVRVGAEKEGTVWAGPIDPRAGYSAQFPGPLRLFSNRDAEKDGKKAVERFVLADRSKGRLAASGAGAVLMSAEHRGRPPHETKYWKMASARAVVDGVQGAWVPTPQFPVTKLDAPLRLYFFSPARPLTQGLYELCDFVNDQPAWGYGSFRIWNCFVDASLNVHKAMSTVPGEGALCKPSKEAKENAKGFWVVSEEVNGKEQRLFMSEMHEGRLPPAVKTWKVYRDKTVVMPCDAAMQAVDSLAPSGLGYALRMLSYHAEESRLALSHRMHAAAPEALVVRAGACEAAPSLARYSGFYVRAAYLHNKLPYYVRREPGGGEGGRGEQQPTSGQQRTLYVGTLGRWHFSEKEECFLKGSCGARTVLKHEGRFPHEGGGGGAVQWCVPVPREGDDAKKKGGGGKSKPFFMDRYKETTMVDPMAEKVEWVCEGVSIEIVAKTLASGTNTLSVKEERLREKLRAMREEVRAARRKARKPAKRAAASPASPASPPASPPAAAVVSRFVLVESQRYSKEDKKWVAPNTAGGDPAEWEQADGKRSYGGRAEVVPPAGCAWEGEWGLDESETGESPSSAARAPNKSFSGPAHADGWKYMHDFNEATSLLAGAGTAALKSFKAVAHTIMLKKKEKEKEGSGDVKVRQRRWVRPYAPVRAASSPEAVPSSPSPQASFAGSERDTDLDSSSDKDAEAEAEVATMDEALEPVFEVEECYYEVFQAAAADVMAAAATAAAAAPSGGGGGGSSRNLLAHASTANLLMPQASLRRMDSELPPRRGSTFGATLAASQSQSRHRKHSVSLHAGGPGASRSHSATPSQQLARRPTLDLAPLESIHHARSVVFPAKSQVSSEAPNKPLAAGGGGTSTAADDEAQDADEEEEEEEEESGEGEEEEEKEKAAEAEAEEEEEEDKDDEEEVGGEQDVVAAGYRVNTTPATPLVPTSREMPLDADATPSSRKGGLLRAGGGGGAGVGDSNNSNSPEEVISVDLPSGSNSPAAGAAAPAAGPTPPLSPPAALKAHVSFKSRTTTVDGSLADALPQPTSQQQQQQQPAASTSVAKQASLRRRSSGRLSTVAIEAQRKEAVMQLIESELLELDGADEDVLGTIKRVDQWLNVLEEPLDNPAAHGAADGSDVASFAGADDGADNSPQTHDRPQDGVSGSASAGVGGGGGADAKDAILRLIETEVHSFHGCDEKQATKRIARMRQFLEILERPSVQNPTAAAAGKRSSMTLGEGGADLGEAAAAQKEAMATALARLRREMGDSDEPARQAAAAVLSWEILSSKRIVASLALSAAVSVYALYASDARARRAAPLRAATVGGSTWEFEAWNARWVARGRPNKMPKLFTRAPVRRRASSEGSTTTNDLTCADDDDALGAAAVDATAAAAAVSSADVGASTRRRRRRSPDELLLDLPTPRAATVTVASTSASAVGVFDAAASYSPSPPPASPPPQAPARAAASAVGFGAGGHEALLGGFYNTSVPRGVQREASAAASTSTPAERVSLGVSPEPHVLVAVLAQGNTGAASSGQLVSSIRRSFAQLLGVESERIKGVKLTLYDSAATSECMVSNGGKRAMRKFRLMPRNWELSGTGGWSVQSASCCLTSDLVLPCPRGHILYPTARVPPQAGDPAQFGGAQLFCSGGHCDGTGSAASYGCTQCNYFLCGTCFDTSLTRVKGRVQ